MVDLHYGHVMKRKVGTDRLVGTILKNPRTNIRDRVSLDVDFSLSLSENMGKDVKKISHASKF